MSRMIARDHPLRGGLDRLYRRHDHRRLVTTDPIATVYRYDDAADQEVVALIAKDWQKGSLNEGP